MSASNQKKLRKEQAAARMTERQLAEAKDRKRLKIYTATFWVVLALCVCIVIGSIAVNPIKNAVYRGTDALSVGSHTLSAVEVNYFYIDAVNAYVNQVSSYISYILDTKKPLNEQVADKETGATWADKFLDMALDNVKSTYALYDLAMDKGHKLTEDEQKGIDSTMTTLSLYAQIYGYKNTDAYLQEMYGNGANEETYKEYYTKSAIADSYYTAYADSLKYDDKALRAYEKDKFHEYSSYTFSTYYLNYADYREGGVKGEDGKWTYTAAENDAARKVAKELADKLAAGEYKDLKEFGMAIQQLHDKTKDGKPTEYNGVLYDEINSLFKDWVTGKTEIENEDDKEKAASTDDKKEEEPKYEYIVRQDGEMTVIANESGSGENKTVNGYYIVRFESVNENKIDPIDVRHILIKFEGGTKDSSGNVTYSEAEKNAAKEKAQTLLDKFLAGDKKTAEAFGEIAKQNTQDTGSKETGGLYETVYPGDMVENFNDWCFDSERKVGDTGLVESEYGYHVMFFVGHCEGELNYRDYMLSNDKRSEDITAWHKELVDAVKIEELDLSYVEMDMTLA